MALPSARSGARPILDEGLEASAFTWDTGALPDGRYRVRVVASDAAGTHTPPCIGIGANCSIEGAIIDKNACIGDGVIIKPFPRGTDIVTENWAVQDGIVVIPKNAVLQAGTRIQPGK